MHPGQTAFGVVFSWAGECGPLLSEAGQRATVSKQPRVNGGKPLLLYNAPCG